MIEGPRAGRAGVEEGLGLRRSGPKGGRPVT